MYYLDYFKLYRETTREQRLEVRRTLNRDACMAERLKRQRYQCFYCAISIGMDGHLDHIIPVRFSGTNRPKNLVAACRQCNLFKHTGQIEITNPYTISEYLKLQAAYKKFHDKRRSKGIGKHPRYVPKRVQLYTVYRADCFKSI